MFPTKESMDILVDGIPFKDIPIVHIKATGNNTIIIATDKGK
jgi:ribosomal protein S11